MNNLENQAKAEALYRQLCSANISAYTVTQYERCLQLNPNHVLALWDVGCLYAGDQDHAGSGSYWDELYLYNYKRALECFTKIIEIDPKFSKAYRRLGSFYYSSNMEKALMYFLQYLNLNPQDYGMIAKIGDIYYLQKNKQGAIVNYTKCIQHDQKNYRALDGMAKIYEDQGNFKEALKYLKKCSEIRTKDGDIHAHIGRIYNKMGNIKEALDSYRKCNYFDSYHKQANAYLHKHIKKDLQH